MPDTARTADNTLPTRGEGAESPSAATAAPSAAATGTPAASTMVRWVVASGMFMSQLDSTILTTSIPQIAASLDENPLHLNVAITAYLISLAVFIPISGWIADRFGPRRVFCAAIAVFTLSAAMCGLSTSLWQLVTMRVIQGFGGALMTPVGRLILVRSFPKDQLLAAMAYVSIPALVAPAVGPIIGGFLTTYMSWHWIFFVNLPIGMVGIALALRYVRNFEAPPPMRFDFRGFFVVGMGLALLQFSIENLGHPLVSKPVLVALFAGAAAMLALYTLHALGRSDAVLDLNLFRIRTFRASTVSGGLCRLAIGAVPFLLPLMLQVGFGLAPIASGFITFVTSIGAIGMKTVATRLARRFGFRNLLVYNAGLLGSVIAGMALFQPDTPHWFMLTYLILYGVIRATQFTNVQALAYADLPAEAMSRGTSMASVAQQLSSSFGVAVAATTLSLVVGSATEITPHDFHIAFIVVGMMPVLGVIGFVRLKPTDGAEIAGQQGRRRRG
ncbi:MAG TPA: DHA2 family efflux MFS transporter permease subunit [Alphaproteobacteria bacterium]|jgi:EmrB/QacA subfamily drug resistance transporter|nr:DHA2 family efflux MFS transporter permease subunit [Alphaproteobacteria bacterium]